MQTIGYEFSYRTIAMTDQLIRATAAKGGIRLVAVNSTLTCRYARQRHGLSCLTTALLGRAMTAGLLLASSMKVTHSRVNLKVRSDGLLDGLTVDAGRDGTVRGYVGNPKLELDLVKNPSGSYQFDFRNAVGIGYLNVVRDNGRGDPFSSTVELVNGSIAEDVASYLLYCEQTPSALYLGEEIDSDSIKYAGGLLIQVLPKAAEETGLVELLDEYCRDIQNFSERLCECNGDLMLLLQSLFPALEPQLLHNIDNPQPINFHCPCSWRRSLRALRILQIDEIISLLHEDGFAELNCHFCGEIYRVTSNNLEKIISQLSSQL
uniref:Molecular chaperone Hsp33 n=1 Tax=Paulinella micropora TaxID=1928728 RepID=A0A385I1M1_9EUKA|nr:molecular chaperone Hsp33 [Paulinella micropora]AXY63740.1 molecular chaperone Hsp33 [Paulinella micropora]